MNHNHLQLTQVESKTRYVCFTLETPFIAYLLWKWFCFSLLGFLFCFRFCFSSMCYTDVCNVLAINVQCYLMPNKIYVMLLIKSCPLQTKFLWVYRNHPVHPSIRLSVQMPCKCNSFWTDKPILIKLYTVAV